IAELRGGEHADLITAVGPFLDFLRRPERLGMVGFRNLVHMRPLELGLGAGRCGCNQNCGREREAVGPKTLPVRHTFLPGLWANFKLRWLETMLLCGLLRATVSSQVFL